MEDVDPEEKIAHALEAAARAAQRLGLDFDARAEIQETRSASYDQEGIQAVSNNRLAGVCTRVWVEGASGFASTHSLDVGSIDEMVSAAARLAKANARRANTSFPFVPIASGDFSHRPEVAADPLQAQIPDMIDLLERCQAGSLELDPECQPRASLAGQRRRVLYTDATGRKGDCTFVLTTLAAIAVRREAGRLGSGVAFLGGERGLKELGAGTTPEEIGQEAAEDAKEAVEAVSAPGGRQRVLCDNALSGAMAHESFGHLIEYDVVEMDWSRLAGHMGQRFADDFVNVVDAPVAPTDPADGVRVPYDEEGVTGREVRILEEGVLNEWLHVRGSAVEEGVEPTGNGRAYSVRFPPIARMRNTFFEPGDMTPEEALEALDDGVYLVGTRGGAPASDGTFMFTSQKGYRVEDGEIQEPLRSTSLQGNILDFLENVEGMTRELSISATNFGGCGKWGQSFLPVGIGGPHVLVDDVLVGGEGP